MNVAIVNQPWNTLELPARSGSIAIWSYQVARRLADSCQIALVGQRKPAQQPFEQGQGLTCHRLPVATDLRLAKLLAPISRLWPVRRPVFASMMAYRGFGNALARLVHEQDFDIAHIHNLTQLVPMIRRRPSRVKIILHMHCEWLDQLDTPMMAARAQMCDMIVGCSDHITNLTRRRFPMLADRCRTLANGVDTDAYSPAQPANHSPGPNILFVGRVSPEKGLHDLVDAFRTVRQACPQARLRIVGANNVAPSEFLVDLSNEPLVLQLKRFYQGSYLMHLKSRAGTDLEAIEFVGHVAHTELVDYYRQADVVVCPSLSESFGMSLIEAMACGKPVVATAVGGMKEIVTEGQTGRLCPPAKPELFAEAMLTLLGNPRLSAAMGEAARRRAIQEYSWDHVSRKTLECYHELAQP